MSSQTCIGLYLGFLLNKGTVFICLVLHLWLSIYYSLAKNCPDNTLNVSITSSEGFIYIINDSKFLNVPFQIVSPFWSGNKYFIYLFEIINSVQQCIEKTPKSFENKSKSIIVFLRIEALLLMEGTWLNGICFQWDYRDMHEKWHAWNVQNKEIKLFTL